MFRNAVLSATCFVLAFFPAGCSKGQRHSSASGTTVAKSAATDAALPTTTPPDLGDSILHWANEEPVILVTNDVGLIARAMDSGRTKVLRAGPAEWVLLDTELELAWIQGQASLHVLDLRRPSEKAVLIAQGLTGSLKVQIDRDTGAESTHLEVPEVCVQPADLFLEWNREPILHVLAGDPEEEKRQMGSASLVGTAWLRAELGRASTGPSVARLEFGPASAALKPANTLKCALLGDWCGKALPFDGSGRMLLLTDYSEGDCQHYGCRLYDPATKKYATPPDASSWTEMAKVAPGPCGPYHFDHAGKYFFNQERVCKVGGSCEKLGGRGIGWIGGGTDVGTDG